MISIPHQPCIYKIICHANGKIYVGSTSSPRRRWYLHKWELNRQKHDNVHLQRAWDIYGENQFEFIIIEFVARDQLITREQYWLDNLQVCNHEIGFNIAVKANSGTAGRNPSIETRIKISNANRGKIRSQETRTKISASRKGLKFSSKHCANLSTALKGRVISNEARKKMSVAHKGKPQKPEAVKIRAELLCKEFIVIDPNGNEYRIKGISKFCRENHLSIGSIYRVIQGKQSHHKGWKCKPVN